AAGPLHLEGAHPSVRDDVVDGVGRAAVDHADAELAPVDAVAPKRDDAAVHVDRLVEPAARRAVALARGRRRPDGRRRRRGAAAEARHLAAVATGARRTVAVAGARAALDARVAGPTARDSVGVADQHVVRDAVARAAVHGD